MQNHAGSRSSFGRRLARLALALAAACASPVAVAADAGDAVKNSYRRPGAIPFPKDDAFSDPKLALGQMLFFDPRLSGAGTMSCASCHNPALNWQDGQRVAFGHAENKLARATPTILDLAWGDLMMWDGRKDSLEDQVSGPVASADEMGGSVDEAVARLRSLPGYRVAFKAAFGSETIGFDRVASAVATFERTVVSNLSPFDRWIEGDARAIGPDAQRGFALFNGKANCAACHSGWRFTDDAFHDIGLPSEDPGRGREVPDEPVLMHAFKTPTLRNVADRAPYMHDGSIATLRDAVVHYDTGYIERASLSPDMHRLGLTPHEVDDIVAFLRTLTSNDDQIAAPTLPEQEQN